MFYNTHCKVHTLNYSSAIRCMPDEVQQLCVCHVIDPGHDIEVESLVKEPEVTL